MDEFEKALEAEVAEEFHSVTFMVGARWAREWLQEDSSMKLAGVSTACLQNTEKTIKDRIDKSNPYWTVAYGDVCDTVDREMKLRTENAKLRGALEKIKREAGNSHDCHYHPRHKQTAEQALKETGGDE
jgi:hypothetical protein